MTVAMKPPPAMDSSPAIPAVDDWALWRDGAHDPAWNMAADQWLLDSAPERGRPLLRLYGWDRPAVSLGYTQPLEAAPPGLPAVRRPTGGGVVFHGEDLTYTVVIPAAHPLAAVDRLRSYALVNGAVLAALAACGLAGQLAAQEIPKSVDRATMVCFTTPTRYDILAAGHKVAGSAQRRTRAGILHQGSLLLGADSAGRRAALLTALPEGFARTLNARFAPFQPDAAGLAAVQLLADQVFATGAWNRHRRG